MNEPMETGSDIDPKNALASKGPVILTIDLCDVEGMDDLYTQTAALTQYRYRYTDPYVTLYYALSNAVYSQLIFVYHNFNDLKRRSPWCAMELRDTAWRLANRDDVFVIILEGLPNDIFWSNPFVRTYLFRYEPRQFGLRGDEPLWHQLSNYFRYKCTSLADDELNLPQQIYDAIEVLTGQTIEPGKNFHIAEFDNGGMSGGIVCSDFWLNRGMDFLVARHRELKRVWLG